MEQEFVTLPSNAVEHALAALIDKCIATYAIHGTSDYMIVDDGKARAELLDALRAALEQPKNHIEQHLDMVPAGWKLVPVMPTRGMLDAAHKDLVRDAEIDMMLKGIHSAMLDAAPQPPALEQPQAEQPAMTPIAQRKLDSLLTEGYTISGYSVYHERKHQHGFVTGAGLVGWWKPEGMEYPQPRGEQEPVAWLTIEVMGPRTRADVEWEDQLQKLPSGIYKLYTNPQPKSEPLTDEQIDAIADAMPGGLEGFMKGWGWRQFARAVLEATHNIK